MHQTHIKTNGESNAARNPAARQECKAPASMPAQTQTATNAAKSAAMAISPEAPGIRPKTWRFLSPDRRDLGACPLLLLVFPGFMESLRGPGWMERREPTGKRRFSGHQLSFTCSLTSSGASGSSGVTTRMRLPKTMQL